MLRRRKIILFNRQFKSTDKRCVRNWMYQQRLRRQSVVSLCWSSQWSCMFRRRIIWFDGKNEIYAHLKISFACICMISSSYYLFGFGSSLNSCCLHPTRINSGDKKKFSNVQVDTYFSESIHFYKPNMIITIQWVKWASRGVMHVFSIKWVVCVSFKLLISSLTNHDTVWKDRYYYVLTSSHSCDNAESKMRCAGKCTVFEKQLF